ncbi:ABC transporter transmembrane domain-containing protein, partial [Mycolicibacter heraklionensis]|uniref:ABC transporter transmembrane domain-containing protein n=1 Tax=Mycolicibacter heraklionensis TaxID=512402 RepID=UPI0010424AD2
MLLALLRCYLRPYRRPVAAVMALQLISTLASLYLPTVNATIIDDGVVRGDTAIIVRLGAVMLGVTGVQMLCAIAAVYFGARTGTGFGRDLRRAVFAQVIRFSERETTRFGAPTLLTRTTNDVRQIQLVVQLGASSQASPASWWTAISTPPMHMIGAVTSVLAPSCTTSWIWRTSLVVRVNRVGAP